MDKRDVGLSYCVGTRCPSLYHVISGTLLVSLSALQCSVWGLSLATYPSVGSVRITGFWHTQTVVDKKPIVLVWRSTCGTGHLVDVTEFG